MSYAIYHTKNNVSYNFETTGALLDKVSFGIHSFCVFCENKVWDPVWMGKIVWLSILILVISCIYKLVDGGHVLVATIYGMDICCGL